MKLDLMPVFYFYAELIYFKIKINPNCFVYVHREFLSMKKNT